jgi:hypothetical protein
MFSHLPAVIGLAAAGEVKPLAVTKCCKDGSRSSPPPASSLSADLTGATNIVR